VLVAGDVLGDVCAGTFGVAHLAEDTSARAGDAFDGLERSVRIELDAVRGRTARIMGSDPIMLRWRHLALNGFTEYEETPAGTAYSWPLIANL
jgi:hypothetical protein